MIIMKTLWICVLLFSAVCANEFGDYDYDYDPFEDTHVDGKALNEKTDIENDLKVEEEIQQFREEDGDNLDVIEEPKDTIDSIDDYQFEDNRDKSKEDVDDTQPLPDENNSFEPNNNLEQPEDDNRPEEHNDNDYAMLWGDDSVAPLPVPEKLGDEDQKAILEETKKILEEDSDMFGDEIKDLRGPSSEDGIIDEQGATSKQQDGVNQDEVKDNESGEELAKAYADLNADLDKLLDTFDKLEEDISESEEKKNEGMDKYFKDIDDLMEDYDTHNFDDYDALFKNDEDLDKLFEEIVKNVDENEDTISKENDQLKDTVDENEIKEEDVVDDERILEDVFGEDEVKSDNLSEDKELNNDEINEPNPDDAFEKDVETFDNEFKRFFGDDALVDNEADLTDVMDSANADVKIEEVEQENEDKKAVKTATIDELNSAELDDLVSQFSVLHSEDLDVHADSFDKNIAPIRITLKLDEPTIITSPDYPNPYPTNNIVDWIISGEGTGIELNITEFAVNGALGDYLLIKPGGVDESGHDGLLFTYRLTSARRYRFTDVDRVFMRFESRPGMMFMRGFQLSAKMIAPLPEDPEPSPEPEAVITLPHSTATLFLSLSVFQFESRREPFQGLLTDMAVEYLKERDEGMNTSSVQAHITNVRLCPVSWPNFENCAAVAFGVTVDYHEEELTVNDNKLEDMFRDYSGQEPWASRLREMGIFEFEEPSNTVLTAWVVIGAGVVACVGVLAVLLWRYSCVENYTRMKTYSDTDSIHNEKRALDLYPTPHQTLPPLYSESEYKWTHDHTTVNMDGFANKSYATDNMYDFESDEDVPARDRNGAEIPKDVYKV